MADVQQDARTSVVIGIDLSSKKVAMVWEEGKKFGSATISTDKKDRSAALHDLLLHTNKELITALNKVPAEDVYLYIEDPVVGRGGARPTILQSQVDGIVRVCAYPHTTKVYSVNNKTWKKAIVGNGNASKDDVAAWLATHHSFLAELCGDDQDLLDAACVCLYGRYVIDHAERR